MQQAPKRAYASIPDPDTTNEGLFKTVQALKQTLEMVIGTRGGPSPNERKPSIFVQYEAPSDFKEGDFWLCKTGDGNSLSVSVSGTWQVVWP